MSGSSYMVYSPVVRGTHVVLHGKTRLIPSFFGCSPEFAWVPTVSTFLKSWQPWCRYNWGLEFGAFLSRGRLEDWITIYSMSFHNFVTSGQWPSGKTIWWTKHFSNVLIFKKIKQLIIIIKLLSFCTQANLGANHPRIVIMNSHEIDELIEV